MAAYVIAEVEVIDAPAYEAYRKLVGPTVEKFGGRYLVRGGQVESKEGDWRPSRFVIIEFASMARAQAWYHSTDYAPALALRAKAATSKLIFAEGL
ncbi:MAG: DUF1330 domain-containing protein [Proteobacteria bacterium]|nr:DUF1330 domain-containing protein [Pseudomonadota bacterium]